METYPELNATNSSEQSTDRWTFPILGQCVFDLAHLATAFAATSDLPHYMDAPQVAIFVNRPRHDVGALEELYAFDALPDLDELAEAQNITPVTDFEALLGDSWPEGESVEDFIAAATEGRYERETPSP